MSPLANNTHLLMAKTATFLFVCGGGRLLAAVTRALGDVAPKGHYLVARFAVFYGQKSTHLGESTSSHSTLREGQLVEPLFDFDSL